MIVGLFLFIIVNWGYVNKTELLEKKKKTQNEPLCFFTVSR